MPTNRKTYRTRQGAVVQGLAAFALVWFTVASAVARDYDIWSVGSAAAEDTWSSRSTDHLSKWETIDCLGFGADFLLSGLTGYREPWGNLDNFIARLNVACTQFDRKSSRPVTLFTSEHHRETPYVLDAFDWKRNGDLLCPGYYFTGPFGAYGVIESIEIGTNPGGDYIKNFRFHLRCSRLNDEYAITWQTVGDANAMIYDRGYEMYYRKKLSCPGEDYAVTGIDLRYSTNNAKIRDLRIHCRQLKFQYLPTQNR